MQGQHMIFVYNVALPSVPTDLYLSHTKGSVQLHCGANFLLLLALH